ncbi:hypothetical protein KIN20_034386 [Parelaphostrongylus tenuis]|uniref:Uncharacterized protein n=1 Tax=Parelaphostrongylus tenuis TaxID=148309 RepID=A0AAD5WJ63_PARTN|nr:hypothetical protein KIN20_034386 [Parelaphostrongylus tenuis]
MEGDRASPNPGTLSSSRSQIPRVGRVHSSSSIEQKNEELLEHKSKIVNLESELMKVKRELDIAKNHSQLKDQNLAVLQQKTEITRLENELSERLEIIGRLLSELAAKRDELRGKDEELRLLHNTVVDLKVPFLLLAVFNSL